MTPQLPLSLHPRSTDELLADKIERISLALTDPDIEPAAFARLTLEVNRLRRLLRACSQTEATSEKA